MTTRHQLSARIKDGHIHPDHMALIDHWTRTPYCNVKTPMALRAAGLIGPHHNVSEDAGRPVVCNER